MRRGPAVLLGVLAGLYLPGGGVRAMPGAMPWDHAGGPGRPDCTDCHFDAGAVAQSPALSLAGLPEKAESGKSYNLVLRLVTDHLKTSGFLMRAETGPPGSGKAPPGRFRPANERTEAGEAAIRSTVAGARATGPGVAEWRFSWQAPQDFAGTLTMYIAATAANDDQSPLGDRVHLLQVDGTIGPKGQ